MEPFFCMSCKKYLLKCPYSKKPVLPRKIPGCAPVTFNLLSWFLQNLPIYRNLIHDNISLAVENQESFVQYYFEGDISFLFINNLCQCYFEENKKHPDSYLFALLQNIPKDIVPIVPISVITSILLKLHRLSTILEQLRIGSQSRKCWEMIQWKQRVQKLRRFDIEMTQKNPRGELIDISWILKVESTSKFPR